MGQAGFIPVTGFYYLPIYRLCFILSLDKDDSNIAFSKDNIYISLKET